MGFWPGISMHFSFAARLQRCFGTCSGICLKLMLGGAVNWCRRNITSSIQMFLCCHERCTLCEWFPDRHCAVTPKENYRKLKWFFSCHVHSKCIFLQKQVFFCLLSIWLFAYFMSSSALQAILSSGFRGRTTERAVTQQEVSHQWEEQTVDVSENEKASTGLCLWQRLQLHFTCCDWGDLCVLLRRSLVHLLTVKQMFGLMSKSA